MFSGSIYLPANTSIETDVLFYTTHTASILLALLALLFIKYGYNPINRTSMWVAGIALVVCEVILITDTGYALKLVACILVGGSTGILTVIWIESFAVYYKREFLKTVPLSFVLTAIVSLPLLIQNYVVDLTCMVAFPILSCVILDNLAIKKQKRPMPSSVISKRKVLRQIYLPFAAYFSMAIISVAMMNMTIIAPIGPSVSSNYLYIILAIALGSAISFMLPKGALLKPTLPQVLLLLAVATLIALPFAGSFLQIAIEILVAAEVRILLICAIVTCISVSHQQGVSSLVMGCIFYMLLAASLVLGSIISAICTTSVWDEDFQFITLMAICVYLLFVTLLVSLLSKRKGPVDIEISETALPTNQKIIISICGDLAEENGLSKRETEVLALLFAGRSDSYIAENLHISKNTAKSHIKRIYQKLNIHHRQDLHDLLNLV
jgi:DNA-binding CsgD family transcriptional regulator